MLAQCDVIPFVATFQPDRAKAFYQDVLGLRLLADTPFALVFAVGVTTLRISKVKDLTPAPYTVLGWKVTDIRSVMTELTNKGITFERYEGMPQDDFGIWTTPDGHQVSWFRDPDGNTLSLTEFPFNPRENS